MTDRCPKCQAVVRIATTVSNKPTLIDADASEDGNTVLIDTTIGTRAIEVLGASDFAGMPRHTSHDDTCKAGKKARFR